MNLSGVIRLVRARAPWLLLLTAALDTAGLPLPSEVLLLWRLVRGRRASSAAAEPA